MMKRWQRVAPIGLSLVLSTVIVIWFRADYFRPYVDTPQSSLASSDLHDFAWASTLYTNPLDLLFVARRVTLDGMLSFYPHYTNGYPLLVRAYYAAFGDGLLASRMLPISLVAIGAIMFLAALQRDARNPLAFLALPLLYLSSIGRDAANFEMLEPAHFPIVGLCALVLYGASVPRWAKAACIVLCVTIYQVSAVFILAIIVAEYLRARNRADLAVTVLALFAVALVVAGAFLRAGGVAEFERILLQRSGIDSTVYGFDESVSFAALNQVYSIRVHQSIAPLLFFMSVVEIVLLIMQRRFLLPSVYLGFIAYSIVLRNFVGMHSFTFLPFIFFVIVALLSLAWRLASLAATRPLVRAGVIVLALGWLVVDIAPRNRMYGEDDRVHADLDAITGYVADHDISRCSTFEVTGLLTDERIVYFLLARQINRGSGERCKIALAPHL